MKTAAFAVAMIAANVVAWEGIPALADATSYRVSSSILYTVTLILAILAVAVGCRPLFIWVLAIAGATVQLAMALLTPASALSTWEYVPTMVTMAGSAAVDLAAIAAIVAALQQKTDR